MTISTQIVAYHADRPDCSRNENNQKATDQVHHDSRECQHYAAEPSAGYRRRQDYKDKKEHHEIQGRHGKYCIIAADEKPAQGRNKTCIAGPERQAISGEFGVKLPRPQVRQHEINEENE
jgi:hypothetical protein